MVTKPMCVFVPRRSVSNDTANATGNSEYVSLRMFDLAYSAEAL